MEHYRPNGALSQGYFCDNCGDSCNMYATGHYPAGTCIPNPTIVAALRKANPPQGIKPHFKLAVR